MTAILFILVGTVLLLQRLPNPRQLLSSVTRMVSVLVIIVASYILVHNLVNIFPDIEGFLANPATSASGSTVGRMSPVTAIIFIMVSISLFDSTIRHRKPHWLILPSNILSIGVFIAAILILSGYWYGAPLFYGGTITPVALLTAASFLLVSTAQLFNAPENFFYNLVTSSSVYAQICRAIIPILILVLLAGGYFEEMVRSRLSSDMHSVVSVISTFSILAVITLIVAIVSKRVERTVAQKEAAVTKSEENFRRSIDDSPLGIRIVTNDGQLIYANKAILDIWGFSSLDELKASSAKELYTPATFVEHETRKELRKQGKPVPPNYEISITRKDGETRHLSVSRKEVMWNGKIEAQVVYQDITESKETENKLLQSEEKFSALFRNSPDAISLTSLDDGRFIEVNDSMLRTSGYTYNEIIGRTTAEVGLWHDLNDRKKYAELLKSKGMVIDMDAKVRRKSGELIDCLFSGQIISMQGGQYILSIIRDVTERKQAEKMLKSSEKRFHDLVENLPLSISITSPEGQTFMVNKAFLSTRGYDSEQDLMQAPISTRYFDPKDRENWLAQIKEQGKVENEVRLRRKDGSVFWALSVSLPLTTDSGEQHIISVTQDITERKQAEAKLRESEERFRGLAEQSPNIIFINQAGKVVYANSRCEEITGYKRDEFYSPNFDFLMLSPPECREKVMENFKRHMAFEEVLPYDYTLVTRDGKRIECIMTTKLIDYQGSKAIMGIITDITERKQAEEMFRSLAVNSPVGVYLVQEGKFIYTNPQFQKDTGYSGSELLGMDSLNLVSPEDREIVKENAVQMLKGNRSNPYEYRLITKQGELRWSSETIAPIEYKGRRASLGSYQNITQRRQSEETVRLQAELLDLESDSVDLHDFEGNILYANRAFYNTLGYSKEELLQMNLSQIDDPEANKLVPARLAELGEKGKVTFNVNHRRKDGSWIPMEIHSSLIELGGRKLIISVAHDISEFQKVQQQLMAQDRLASIGQLVSGVAHEINNPLTSVIGFSDLMLKGELPEDIRADLTVINNEALRTARIVKNLLTFARNKPETKTLVDVNENILEVLNLRDHEQRVNNIVLFTEFASDLPQIIGNRSQLQQVFFNLIINAEQAMLEAHGNGKLKVATERTGDMIRISVVDDGPGISPENMKRLFTPFFTTKEVGKGTGLGLSICHGIITEHNGRIYARSEPDKGTMFIIELPAGQTVEDSGCTENP